MQQRRIETAAYAGAGAPSAVSTAAPFDLVVLSAPSAAAPPFEPLLPPAPLVAFQLALRAAVPSAAASFHTPTSCADAPAPVSAGALLSCAALLSPPLNAAVRCFFAAAPAAAFLSPPLPCAAFRCPFAAAPVAGFPSCPLIAAFPSPALSAVFPSPADAPNDEFPFSLVVSLQDVVFRASAVLDAKLLPFAGALLAAIARGTSSVRAAVFAHVPVAVSSSR